MRFYSLIKLFEEGLSDLIPLMLKYYFFAYFFVEYFFGIFSFNCGYCSPPYY